MTTFNTFGNQRSSGPTVVHAALVLFALFVLFCTGCAKQNLAPELQYSQEEAVELRDKIDKFEW